MKHESLIGTSKEWLGRDQDNVPELSDISILGLLFQCSGAIQKNPTKRIGLVQTGHNHHLIET